MKHFCEKDAAYIIQQILLALSYMHQKKIIHRDLKPENILLESKRVDQLELKITDFGFACFFNPQKGLNDCLGSPLYMAPEVIREQQYDEKADIWSIGIITYVLLSGRAPFKGKNKDEIFKSIKNNDINFNLPIFKNISSMAMDFLKVCIQIDAKDRQSSTDLLNHPWMKYYDMKKTLQESAKLDIAFNLQQFKVRIST